MRRAAGCLDEICATLHAAPVQHIGKILVIYRPAPEKAVTAPKKTKPKRKPVRRTKRSFQALSAGIKPGATRRHPHA